MLPLAHSTTGSTASTTCGEHVGWRCPTEIQIASGGAMSTTRAVCGCHAPGGSA